MLEIQIPKPLLGLDRNLLKQRLTKRYPRYFTLQVPTGKALSLRLQIKLESDEDKLDSAHFHRMNMFALVYDLIGEVSVSVGNMHFDQIIQGDYIVTSILLFLKD